MIKMSWPNVSLFLFVLPYKQIQINIIVVFNIYGLLLLGDKVKN